MSSTEYVKAAIDILTKQMEKIGIKFPSRVSTPFVTGHVPELDSTPELNSEDTTHSQELMGIFRWSVEIGRVEILTELSMLSAY